MLNDKIFIIWTQYAKSLNSVKIITNWSSVFEFEKIVAKATSIVIQWKHIRHGLSMWRLTNILQNSCKMCYGYSF